MVKSRGQKPEFQCLSQLYTDIVESITIFGIFITPTTMAFEQTVWDTSICCSGGTTRPEAMKAELFRV